MTTKRTTLTKKDISLLREAFNDEIVSLVKDMRATHEANKKLLEKIDKLILKVEKIGIKAELIQETFLDVMVLVKLHNKKFKDLEKRLNEHPSS